MAKKKAARPKAKVARKRAVRPSTEKLVISKQVLDGLAVILREARTRQSRKVCVA